MDKLFLSKELHRNVIECGYTITTEGMYHPDRVMHEFVLLYMLSGEWDIYVGEKFLSLKAGDVVLLPPRVRHYSTSMSSRNMKNIYIHFTPLTNDLKKLPQHIEVPFHINTMGKEDIEHQFREIVNTFHTCHTKNRELLLGSRLEVLLGTLSEISEKEGVGHSMAPLTQDMIRLFMDNPERFFSQTELAEKYGVSVRTLTALFKKATGTSIHAWQTDYKLTAVNDILRYQPTRKLRDLAVSYGFYDEFQLSKLYKKKYGVSPKYGK